MESRVRHQYDASLALVAPGSAAITASATSAQVSIYEITNSPYGALNGRNGVGKFDVVVCPLSVVHLTNETYSLAIQVVNEAGAATTVETIPLTVANQGEYLVFPLQPQTLADFGGDAAAVQIVATLAGGAPSLQYWAFLAPASHA